ncbi:unnamed protein product, partial [Discosporangium mesarthrocarpum]
GPALSPPIHGVQVGVGDWLQCFSEIWNHYTTVHSTFLKYYLTTCLLLKNHEALTFKEGLLYLELCSRGNHFPCRLIRPPLLGLPPIPGVLSSRLCSCQGSGSG